MIVSDREDARFSTTQLGQARKMGNMGGSSEAWPSANDSVKTEEKYAQSSQFFN